MSLQSSVVGKERKSTSVHIVSDECGNFSSAAGSESVFGTKLINAVLYAPTQFSVDKSGTSFATVANFRAASPYGPCALKVWLTLVFRGVSGPAATEAIGPRIQTTSFTFCRDERHREGASRAGRRRSRERRAWPRECRIWRARPHARRPALRGYGHV